MPRSSLKDVLMKRDGMTSEEADKAIANAEKEFLDRLEDGDDCDDFMMEVFGLEPDYIEDMIDGLY